MSMSESKQYPNPNHTLDSNITRYIIRTSNHSSYDQSLETRIFAELQGLACMKPAICQWNRVAVAEQLGIEPAHLQQRIPFPLCNTIANTAASAIVHKHCLRWIAIVQIHELQMQFSPPHRISWIWGQQSPRAVVPPHRSLGGELGHGNVLEVWANDSDDCLPELWSKRWDFKEVPQPDYRAPMSIEEKHHNFPSEGDLMHSASRWK